MRLNLFAFLIIKNADKPICNDCKYFKYDTIYNDLHFGKCAKFANKDLITGKIIFEDIQKARVYHCGTNGTYYEPKMESKI